MSDTTTQQKQTLYVVPHTHWDREWYGSYQLFRLRLVRLMNKLLALLERDPDYKTFNLDGQTIILEDYLEVHPEKREALKQYITEGRLKVGPWYILPDEFLSSGESLVHNLLLGGKIAREYGHRMNVGYIPDTFGHIAQLPQILRGFGLDNTMHFRGLDFQNGDLKSEVWWEAPDGSRVLLHHMSVLMGYSDSGALAADPLRAAYDLRSLAHYKMKRATSNVLLAMQGVDHVEPRQDLTTIVNLANDLDDQIDYVHASLEDYWHALKASLNGGDLQVVRGELRDVPRSPGSMNILLYAVLSSRVDNKLQNARALNSLEVWAEPFAALADVVGAAEYPQGHLWTAWRWLLQNHPHDSMGGCSIDAVHRQMATRFEWATEIADSLAEERFRLVANEIKTDGLRENEAAVVVFNATPFERDEVITVDIDLPEYWLRQRALANAGTPANIQMDTAYEEVFGENARLDWGYGSPSVPEVFFRGIHLRPIDGEEIPVQIESVHKTPLALALASGPRGIMDVRRVRASFRAKLPAYGYSTFAVRTDFKPTKWPAPNLSYDVMHNDELEVQIYPNGTFDLIHLPTGIRYTGLGLFEDSGDNGDGYTFSPPPFNRVYTTHTSAPRISKVGRGVGVQRIRIEYDLQLPVSLNDQRVERRGETTTCPLVVDLVLRDGTNRLEIEITLDNRAKDHRLRMLFPSGVFSTTAHSAMQFDVMARRITPEPIVPGDFWVEDPPSTFPMHGWVDIADGARGLCVVAEGLHEYEILNTPLREIAVTLLRAVGYLGARLDATTIIGGAGPGFETPEAQLQTKLKYRLALVPHGGAWHEAQVWREASAFLSQPRAVTTAEHGTGARPASEGWLKIDGMNVVLSAVKKSEDGAALVIRVYNPSEQATQAKIRLPVNVRAVHTADLEENPLESLPVSGSSFSVDIGAKKIVTLRINL